MKEKPEEAETVKKVEIGRVKSYLNKISVIILENIAKELNVGDTLELQGKEGPFNQEIKSMQIEHESVEHADAGSSVGIKVDNAVKKESIVSKIVE